MRCLLVVRTEGSQMEAISVLSCLAMTLPWCICVSPNQFLRLFIFSLARLPVSSVIIAVNLQPSHTLTQCPLFVYYLYVCFRGTSPMFALLCLCAVPGHLFVRQVRHNILALSCSLLCPRMCSLHLDNSTIQSAIEYNFSYDHSCDRKLSC